MRHDRGLLPRVIRAKDAPFYLGMDRNRFNAEVRPHLTELPIGVQGVGFDRLELDAWVDEYIARNGRPGKGVNSWDARRYPASLSELGNSTSTSACSGGEFAAALAQLSSGKPKPCLRTSWRKSARRSQGRTALGACHDLKHTFGRRLRAAGVSFEDRQDLLGHRSGRITTHYSAAELGRLIEAVEKVCAGNGQPELLVMRTARRPSHAKLPQKIMVSGAGSG